MIKKFYLKFLMGLLLMAFAVPHAQADEAQILGGTSQQTGVPLNCMYGDYGYHSQMVYSKAILEQAGLPAGARITAITFYTASGYNLTASSGSENNPLTIKLGQPESSTLSSFVTENLTTVSTTGNIWSGTTSVTLEFDSDKAYTYDGDNLLIDLSWGRNTNGYYKTIYWLTSAVTGASRYANNNSSGVEQSSTTCNYLPNITITYEVGSVEPITSGEVLTTSLTFDTYAGVPKSLPISIKNTGNQPFTPTFSTLNAPFSIEAATEIPARQTKEFLVTYSRETVGSDNASLTVTINGEATNVALTGTAAEAPLEVDAAVGTDTSDKLPVYGYYYDSSNNNYHQMIYPASMISPVLQGKHITGLTFYSSTGLNFSDGNLAIRLATTDAEKFETTARLTMPSNAVSKNFVHNAGETLDKIIVEFDEPFEYNGGNIIIETQVTSAGTCDPYSSHTNFYGITTTENYSYCAKGSYGSATLEKFLPKVTFSYSDGAGSVTVNPTSLTFGGESFYAGQTEEKDVTVSNTTEEAAAVSITGDNADMFEVKNNVTSVAAGTENGTITVIYKPTAAGTHTATLNVGGKTVTLTGTSVEAPTPTIIASPDALTMNAILGSSATATFNVTGTNLAGDITVAANGNGFSVAPTTITAADAANGVTVTVTYNPTAAGTNNGTVTLTSQGAEDVIVSLTGTCIEVDEYAVSVNPETGHNFGTVGTDQTVTWTIKVKNEGANAITPTLSSLTAPYSTAYTPVTLAYGEETTIVISFAPTAIQAYPDVPVTLSFPGSTIEDYTFTLKGEGVEPTGTLPASFYDGIEYTWIDSENVEHTSTLGEVATDPDQIIALMREVYTNKALPGPYYRGYDANGNPETNYPVAYPAIGTVTRFGAYGVASNYTYNDAGWGITHDEAAYPFDVLYESSSSNNVYKALNGNEYKPNEEGLTLLLVEMKDGVTNATVGNSVTSASGLRNVVDKMFKSVRVITHSKRYGVGAEAGTLFKIDCDKMNRFFFLGKGRLRLYNDAYYDTSHRLGRSNFFIDKKNQTSSSQATSNVVSDEGPFFEMFEQFSPVSLSEGTIADDIYQSLINMESYGVEHDCQYIPWATTDASGSGSAVIGHEFNMYGKESLSEDCQDVRDLMFFIPDQRMKYWSDGTGFSDPRRDKGENDKFVNYYKEMAPTMALYVIRQNPIIGEQKTYNGNENNYELHLTWESNLTSILPAAEGTYFIYQVNDDGTYTQVGTTDANTTELYVNVAMQEHGQQVTYVIQGQDKSRFLSLQMSNEESFIIPGTDPYEKFQLNPNADIYSRFDPAQVINFYANGMQVKTYPDATNDMFAGKTINYYRQAAGDTDWTLVATANVNSDATAATAATVPATQRTQDEYKYGYKTNSGSLSITTDANGYKVFDNLYDNFKADVSTNEHPDYYKYKIVVDGAPADANKYHSNEITVRIYKTRMSTISGTFTDDQIANDEVRTLGIESPSFDIDVTHSSKTEILRYDAYRWGSDDDIEIIDQSSDPDDEQDIAPNGIAGNQGEFYTVAMNSDYVGEDVYVSQGGTNQATFVDNVPLAAIAADEYTYAPVVETFAPTGWGRTDYNTYGAPLQTTATGKITVDVVKQGKSEYTWEANGNTYRYYNVFVNVSDLDLPDGYEVAKVRAWRQIDDSYLGEQAGKGFEGRLNLDTNGEFMFDDPTAVVVNYQLGSEPLEGSSAQNEMYKGTFGALDVETHGAIPMKFFVRVYFKKSNGSKAAGDEYYITEVETTGELTNDIPTSIFGVDSYKVVKNVKYYNMAGVESDVPFQGVNIVVTTYNDGTRSTSKIVK